MNRSLRTIGLVVLLLTVAGCGVRNHIRKHNTPIEVLDPVGVYLEPRVGVMTYDEALVEWGHPKHITEGDSIFLATWTLEEAEKIGGTFARCFEAEEGVKALNASFEIESRKLQSFGFSQN